MSNRTPARRWLGAIALVLAGCAGGSSGAVQADTIASDTHAVTCCIAGKMATCTCVDGQICDASFKLCPDGSCTDGTGVCAGSDATQSGDVPGADATGCPAAQPVEGATCAATAATCAYGGFITCCGQSYGPAVTCDCQDAAFHCTDWQKVCLGELCSDAGETGGADAGIDASAGD